MVSLLRAAAATYDFRHYFLFTPFFAVYAIVALLPLICRRLFASYFFDVFATITAAAADYDIAFRHAAFRFYCRLLRDYFTPSIRAAYLLLIFAYYADADMPRQAAPRWRMSYLHMLHHHAATPVNSRCMLHTNRSSHRPRPSPSFNTTYTLPRLLCR